MYSAQETLMSYISMQRRYITSHVLRGEDNVSSIKDSNSEMAKAQDKSIRSRTLSEKSIINSDLEDSWIVFEDNNLYEKCIPDSLIRKNDNSYKDSNGPLDTTTAPFLLRSLSESSNNSEDSNYSSIASDEQEATECPKMPALRKRLSDEHHKDCNNKMQKDLSQHHHLPLNSAGNSDYITNSGNSEDFTISENFDDSNSSFVTEENDVDDYIETSFPDGDSQLDDSIIFADEDSEELTQKKKVSFDSTPVVHVMVTWNYAYRAARKGPWEEMARDNERFKGRIKSIALVLDPILKSKHRSQVWQQRFAVPEYF